MTSNTSKALIAPTAKQGVDICGISIYRNVDKEKKVKHDSARKYLSRGSHDFITPLFCSLSSVHHMILSTLVVLI